MMHLLRDSARGALRWAVAPIALAAAATSAGAADFDWKRFDGAEITVLMNEHPVTDGMRAVLADFEAETGIKANIQALAEDLYFDRMEIALRASEGAASVYFQPMDSTAYTQYLAGLVHSLSPYLNDPSMTAPDYDLADFPAGFLSATSYPPDAMEKENYGIPISFESYILFYNKEHVDNYLDGNVPATMDELLAAAAMVSDESGGQVAGAAMRGIRSDTLIDTVTGIVYNSFGADATPLPQNVWFDGDWSRPRLTDPRIVRGLANYASLMTSGPINIQALDWPDAARLFQQGRAAFFIDASLFGPGFEDPESSRVADKTGYAVIPADAPDGASYTAHWMWGLGIPANAPNPEAGWYFIQWMTNKAAEASIGAFHGGATRVSTWSVDSYTSALNAEYVEATLTSMQTSRSSVVFREGWSKFALRIVDVIQDIYGGAAPEDAAAAAQADFEAWVE